MNEGRTMREAIDVAVIGAGVSGLTTAVVLAEAGLRVRVYTAEPPEATTSAAAGAMWGPYLVEPREKIQAWSRRTLDEFRRLAADPQTGVRFLSGIEASRTQVKSPDWADQLDGFRICDPSELPQGFTAGWRFTAPLIDMPVYLGYLQKRFTAAGGTIDLQHIENLDAATRLAPVIVNCTGIGARDLVPDKDLMPIRGQLVIVTNPGITEFFTEDTGPSRDLLHIYPHGQTVVLGGLAEPGNWSTRPDQATAAAILDRCAEIEPRLKTAEVIGHRVGLRPTRPQVRVEAQNTDETTIIHNYGHGGAGVTLSWGCAEEAAASLAPISP